MARNTVSQAGQQSCSAADDDGSMPPPPPGTAGQPAQRSPQNQKALCRMRQAYGNPGKWYRHKVNASLATCRVCYGRYNSTTGSYERRAPAAALVAGSTAAGGTAVEAVALLYRP
ncbi:hypothetical protein PLESTF_000414100 [Pleodorina starrii]|nr:hypothetical protein PLESTM_001454800 [Pleodorina starrii]GLC66347.1 hypothetical protein PLESTF_000414100 [Pleodorina starrii]